MSFVNVSGARIRSGAAVVSFFLYARFFSAAFRRSAFCSDWVIAWNLLYGSMFGWMMSTSRFSSAVMQSSYLLPMMLEAMNGSVNAAMSPVSTAVFAFQLNVNHLPSERLTSKPKMPRLHVQIQRDPPNVPVYSYH